MANREDFSRAEVTKLCVVFVDEYVGGFDVPVADVSILSVGIFTCKSFNPVSRHLAYCLMRAGVMNYLST